MALDSIDQKQTENRSLGYNLSETEIPTTMMDLSQSIDDAWAKEYKEGAGNQLLGIDAYTRVVDQTKINNIDKRITATALTWAISADEKQKEVGTKILTHHMVKPIVLIIDAVQENAKKNGAQSVEDEDLFKYGIESVLERIREIKNLKAKLPPSEFTAVQEKFRKNFQSDIEQNVRNEGMQKIGVDSNLPIDSKLPHELSDMPFDVVASKEDDAKREEAIRIALGRLSKRERTVLQERYGFNDDGSKKTLAEIGGMFGVTPERIRQVESKTLHKLSRVRSIKKINNDNQ